MNVARSARYTVMNVARSARYTAAPFFARKLCSYGRAAS